MNSISVIIPSFNREKTIEYCLQSVLNQTYKPLEIIIVDDCSNDRTIDIINSLNSSIIKVVKLEKNSGAQAARNRGIIEAKGDWIAFQDSDDEWLPNKLEIQIGKALSGNFDVIYCECYVQQGASKTLFNTPNYELNTYSRLLENQGPTFPGILAKKSSLLEINLLDEKVPSYQEWDTSIRLGKKNKFGFIDEPLYIYHLHEGETISKDKTRDALGVEYIVNKHKNDIIAFVGKNAYIHHLDSIAKRFLKADNYKKWKEYKIKELEERLPRVKYFGLKKIIIANFPYLYCAIRTKYVNYKERKV